MTKCEFCGKRFELWSAKTVKINRKVFAYCPHCNEMTRVK